jgi:hypothetical protein
MVEMVNIVELFGKNREVTRVEKADTSPHPEQSRGLSVDAKITGA